jgi:hypothetical protein
LDDLILISEHVKGIGFANELYVNILGNEVAGWRPRCR